MNTCCAFFWGLVKLVSIASQLLSGTGMDYILEDPFDTVAPPCHNVSALPYAHNKCNISILSLSKLP